VSKYWPLSVSSKTINYELDRFFRSRAICESTEQCSPDNCLISYQISDLVKKIVFFHSPRGALIAVFPLLIDSSIKDDAVDQLNKAYGDFSSLSPEIVDYKGSSFLVFKWGADADSLFKSYELVIMRKTF
jgi:hypothetical protein